MSEQTGIIDFNILVNNLYPPNFKNYLEPKFNIH